MKNIIRRVLNKIKPMNTTFEIEDPSRGKPRHVKALELSDVPLEDGSYGSVLVNGKVVPIQKSLPLKGYFCAWCRGTTEYPSEYGGDLYCSQLCAHEAGHSVGVGEHILEAQRKERLAIHQPNWGPTDFKGIFDHPKSNVCKEYENEQ